MGTRVYVGRLSYDVRERDLERFFKGYGRVGEILLKNGFGFVEFDDYRDADDAVYELNGKELLGERVSVQHARGSGPRSGGGQRSGGGGGGGRGWGNSRNSSRSAHGYGPPTRTDYRVIVENLSSRVSWQDLKDFMRAAGEVTYADAHKRHKNEGVVEFASRSDMEKAVNKLNGSELNGRKIKVSEDKPRSRRRSRSRSRSRSSRRTKSRSRSKSSSRSRSPRSKSRSPKRERKNTKSRSRSKSRDKSMSRSRSKTPDNARDKSPDQDP